MNKGYYYLLFTSLLLIANFFTHAQVGIGTNSPAASAKLEVSSTSQGFLPPRMTQFQRQAITLPAQGLIIYCTDCGTRGALQIYNGSSWVSLLVSDSTRSIIIGTQEWMFENLDVSNYADGTPISLVSDPAEWAASTAGAWCWYDNSPTNGGNYGKLYNWHAVNNIKGLCPSGWHVPTDAEWTTLETTLGASAGAKMKSLGSIWAYSPIIFGGATTNSSNFTAYPGGSRSSDGSFNNLTYYGFWWSSTSAGSSVAWSRYLSFDFAYLTKIPLGHDIRSGFSVRCIRN